jgi:hypothetical protein
MNGSWSGNRTAEWGGINPRHIGSTVYKDFTSSSDNTCAFFAKSLARIQLLTPAAARASEMKLRTLEARSVCAAFRFFPRVAARFRSATPMLWPVCCCAADLSSAVSSGTIIGASGLSEALLSAEEFGAPRGLGGLPCTVVIAEGGGEIRMRSSSTGSAGVSLAVGGADTGFGRA